MLFTKIGQAWSYFLAKEIYASPIKLHNSTLKSVDIGEYNLSEISLDHLNAFGLKFSR